MKAITVRQPWGWAIIHGGKDIENRTRNIFGQYRGKIAIHAAAQLADEYDLAKSTCDQLARGPLLSKPDWDRPLPKGAIIGTIDVVNAHHSSTCPGGVSSDGRHVRPFCSPWALADHWHIELAYPKALIEPIPARGQLGLWNWAGEL